MALLPLALSEAAIKAVIVVPRFAPRIKGTAFLSWTILCATIGTTIEDVIVLERIAAVVTIPHRKDFGALLKKNLLNFCGELAIKIPEIILRNKRIERNSRANDIIARTNPL
jgi:hypothetical protein